MSEVDIRAMRQRANACETVDWYQLSDEQIDAVDGVRTDVHTLADALEAVTVAAQSFVAKLALCQPEIDARFTLAYVHGDRYSGPNYEAELAALKSALSNVGLKADVCAEGANAPQEDAAPSDPKA